MRKPELQAVVLAAGRGSRMTDLTDSIPKCLLPMANLPMIWYPLAYLANNGFKEAIVCVPEKCYADISRLLTEQCPSLTLRIDFVQISDNNQDEWGTADTLRHIADKITSDVLLLSGDFVCDFALWKLLDFYRIHDAALVAVLSADLIQSAKVPGHKAKTKKEQDYSMLEVQSSRLAFLSSSADLDGQNIPSHDLSIQLNKFPDLTCSDALGDSHLYVMKHWVLDILKAETEITSIKSDLIPFLLKIQALGIEALPEELHSHVSPSPLQSLVTSFSQLNSNKNDSIRCFAFTPDKTMCTVIARCNTVGSYFETNKQIVKNRSRLMPHEISVPLVSNSVSSPQGAHIGADCTVGDQSQLGVKSSLKRSVVGSHCSIGAKAKIVNSLIMDHVTVAEGAVVTNSILCHSAQVGTDARLTDCIVATNKNVMAEEILTSEVVGLRSAQMEIETEIM